MNKNITLLFVVLVFLFSSCKETFKELEANKIERNSYDSISTEYAKIALVKFENFEGYKNNSHGFDFVRDSCEYTYLWTGAGNGGGTIFHKGNCKYCQERNRKMIENLLKKYYHE